MYSSRPARRGQRDSRPSYGSQERGSNRGSGGSFSSGPARGFHRGGASRGGRNAFAFKGSSIHPSKYVKAAIQPEAEVAYDSTNQFADFGFDPRVLQNVEKHGYTTPTPIQDQAIPALMQGRDLVGIANTGTGKTAAFLLPLINKIVLDNNQGALILAPTRELALQIHEEYLAFARGLNLSVTLCIGGMSMSNQINTLRRGPHFVIGTPGRIKDLVQRGEFKTDMFSNIVLDEVDRMLDIGFIRDIKFLISHLPEVRQSSFFSATMNGAVEEIMRSLLRDPVRISVKTRETSDHIEQNIVRIDAGQNKSDVLHSLLIKEEFSRVIVFGRTKRRIEQLEVSLVQKGISVQSIHGDKTQGARQRSLEMFKRGRVQALLATDVAARGIDIEGVTHVINYDEPQSYEDYVHRIGRTGRAGKSGTALTFLGRDN